MLIKKFSDCLRLSCSQRFYFAGLLIGFLLFSQYSAFSQSEIYTTPSRPDRDISRAPNLKSDVQHRVRFDFYIRNAYNQTKGTFEGRFNDFSVGLPGFSTAMGLMLTADFPVGLQIEAGYSDRTFGYDGFPYQIPDTSGKLILYEGPQRYNIKSFTLGLPVRIMPYGNLSDPANFYLLIGPELNFVLSKDASFDFKGSPNQGYSINTGLERFSSKQTSLILGLGGSVKVNETISIFGEYRSVIGLENEQTVMFGKPVSVRVDYWQLNLGLAIKVY